LPSVLSTLSLHDALPISVRLRVEEDMAALFRRAASLTVAPVVCRRFSPLVLRLPARGELPLWKGLSSLKGLLSSNRAFGSTDLGDRKSTRLNSSHLGISY